MSLKAVTEALFKVKLQTEGEAMTQDELFQRAGVVTKNISHKALANLLATGSVKRIGEG